MKRNNNINVSPGKKCFEDHSRMGLFRWFPAVFLFQVVLFYYSTVSWNARLLSRYKIGFIT